MQIYDIFLNKKRAKNFFAPRAGPIQMNDKTRITIMQRKKCLLLNISHSPFYEVSYSLPHGKLPCSSPITDKAAMKKGKIFAMICQFIYGSLYWYIFYEIVRSSNFAVRRILLARF